MKRLLIITFLFYVNITLLQAQERKDSINKAIEQINLLKGIKISGYLQMQYQKISTTGATTIYGGNFPSNIDQRFMLRRSRLKAEYTDKLSKFALQFAASEERINLDEVYIVLTEPWLKTISLKTGIFDRPFGYEIPYSSAKIEYDERSRVNQTLFPKEKDMGLMITIQPPPSNPLKFISLDAGLFNGTGPANKDFDNRKDFIGHLQFHIPLKPERIIADIGFSFYKGGYDNQRKFHFEWENGFKEIPNDTLSPSKHIIGGIDFQIATKWFFGNCQLRSELLIGEQSSTFNSNISPSAAPIDKNNIPIPSFTRSINGGYLLFIQNIVDSKFQLVIKYDWFDPNTKVSGFDIGVLANTGASDMKYSTLGFGFNYYCNEHIKILTYLDIVRNELISVTGYENDIKDNILTFRLQYKF